MTKTRKQYDTRQVSDLKIGDVILLENHTLVRVVRIEPYKTRSTLDMVTLEVQFVGGPKRTETINQQTDHFVPVLVSEVEAETVHAAEVEITPGEYERHLLDAIHQAQIAAEKVSELMTALDDAILEMTFEERVKLGRAIDAAIERRSNG